MQVCVHLLLKVLHTAGCQDRIHVIIIREIMIQCILQCMSVDTDRFPLKVHHTTGSWRSGLRVMSHVLYEQEMVTRCMYRVKLLLLLLLRSPAEHN